MIYSSLNDTENNERGVTIVEFCIIAPIFFLVLFVSLDFLRLTFQSLTIQFTVTHVLREVIVGPENRPTQYASQEEWIEGETIALARNFGLTLDGDRIAICPYSQIVAGIPCDPAVDNAGSPGELITVQVRSPTSGFSYLGENRLGSKLYNLSALVVARNEKWSL